MLRGTIYSLLANIFFGCIYYFSILLRPLNGEVMFGFRIITILPFILLGIFLFRQQSHFKVLCQQLKKRPWLIIIILFNSLNLGVQFWIFLWAPNHGQAIPVSIGYLLLPIAMVAFGKICLKEHLSPLKWLALLFAIIGVGSNIIQAAEISWATLVVGLGYPIYFTLRKYFNINSIAVFFIELFLLLPVSIYYVAQVDMSSVQLENPYIYYFLALLGLLSGSAFIFSISSSNLIPINLFGLFCYIEPLIMLIISFMIGEVLDQSAYLLMICLILSTLCIILERFKRPKINKKLVV